MRSRVLSCLIATVVACGCATKKYVTREVGEVNAKAEALGAQVEATQDRVGKTEVRIGEVDERARAGISEAHGVARQAMAKATEAEQAAKGKLVYEVTLSADKVTFPFDRATLSEDARRTIDDTVRPLAEANRGVYLEIEGHTDSTGPAPYNKVLGQERALAVRNYLHDQAGIALNRMQVISHGSASPVVDNRTRENRAQNRRVVIKVLE